MKKILVIAIILASSNAFAWRVPGSCSFCTKYIQDNPVVVEQAAAFIAADGDVALSDELVTAMELIQNSDPQTNFSDMELVRQVILNAGSND